MCLVHLIHPDFCHSFISRRLPVPAPQPCKATRPAWALRGARPPPPGVIVSLPRHVAAVLTRRKAGSALLRHITLKQQILGFGGSSAFLRQPGAACRCPPRNNTHPPPPPTHSLPPGVEVCVLISTLSPSCLSKGDFAAVSVANDERD